MKVERYQAAVSGRLTKHGIALERAVIDIEGEAKRNAPVGIPGPFYTGTPGQLRASITHTPVRRSGSRLTTRVGSAVRHARMRELGGTIRPVRAKRLFWRNAQTGAGHSAMSVTQRPGGPRQGYQPYLRPAFDKFREFYLRHLKGLG